MPITLEPSDNHVEVECPKCNHRWYTLKVLPIIYNRDKTISCPECNKPLKAPIEEIGE